MGLLSFLRFVAGGTDGGRERFASGPVDRAISYATSSSALSLAQVHAAPVTREFALSVPAVLRGRNVICSIATLPLMTFDRRTKERVEASLLTQIDPHVTNLVTLAMTFEDLIFESVAWWQKTHFGPGGYPVSARHIEASRVSTQPPYPGARNRLPSGIDPSSAVWVDGVPIDGTTMIRFDSPNPALLDVGKRAIKRAAMLEAAASMYAEDPQPLDYMTPADDADPDDDDIQDVLDSWTESRRRRATGWVPGTIKYHSVSNPTPADLQLVQLQQRTDLALANMLGLDPEDVGVSTTSRTYNNATDRRRDKINDTLAPYMLAVTSRLAMNDVTKRAQGVAFDLTDYLKADPATQASVSGIYIDRGVLSVQEVRDTLGLPGIPVEPTLAGATLQREESTTMSTPIPVTFSAEAPAAGRVMFDVPAGVEGFAVDLESRTITGLAVPWGEVTVDGRQWRFAAGSIRPHGVPEPVLMRHEGTPIGVVASSLDTPAGHAVTLRISRTAAGDEALILADDTAITGISVGVDIHTYETDEFGNRTVTDATRREVSLTPFPAFNGARVEKVKLQEEGSTMSEVAATGTATAAPAANTDMVAQLAALLDAKMSAAPAPAPAVAPSLPADFAAQVAELVAEQVQVKEFAERVSPVRETPATVVEPLVYRFDGRKGAADFSTDVFAAIRDNSGEARARLKTFMSEVFVSKANVASLNPNRDRPDLWVDEKEFSTPLWSSIVKGTLEDSTPFVLPKFGSSSGVVGDHTEGTEPTLGSYTTTSQTITPGTLSGKVDVNREVIDQGGNPQLSTVLWAKIRRAYAEALEAKAAALLNGLSAGLTPITITTGVVDVALAKEMRAKLAALQFVRGGFRFRDLKLQVDLYSALAAASDTTGRPLIPSITAQNADGFVAGQFGSLNVYGLVGMPSWALGATSSAASKSWLYDANDVHGWATPPTDLNLADSDVAKVYIGVWGYQATAVTDITGVRAISYDPVV